MNLDEMDQQDNRAAQRTRRIAEFRQRKAQEFLEGTKSQVPAWVGGQGPVPLNRMLPASNPQEEELDRAAVALLAAADSMGNEGAPVPQPVEPELTAGIKECVEAGTTILRAVQGRMYLYERTANGNIQQIDVTDRYRDGKPLTPRPLRVGGVNGGSDFYQKRIKDLDKLPPIMRPAHTVPAMGGVTADGRIVQDTPFPCRRMQTSHDAHMGAVCE